MNIQDMLIQMWMTAYSTAYQSAYAQKITHDAPATSKELAKAVGVRAHYAATQANATMESLQLLDNTDLLPELQGLADVLRKKQ